MRFDSYHPSINFIYFAAVIAATLLFRQPVYIALSFCCAGAYLVQLRGRKGLAFAAALLPLAALFTLWYSVYHHFGVTVLRQNFIGNQVTLEAVVYGAAWGISIGAVLLWLACMHAIVTSDKVVYLFGRISPKLSLFLSVALRMVPRIKVQARRVNQAQRTIGCGTDQGNVLMRLRNCLRLCSSVITWTVESLIIGSESMRSRGYTLRGRTAYAIYRFDYRDRILVVVLFACLTAMSMAVLLDQTSMIFDPALILTPITGISYVFYGIYALFCLLPMLLQLVGQRRFEAARAGMQ